MGWWDTTSLQGGQAHSVGPTVLTQLGEVHPEVPHSFFPFFLKTIVSSVTRQGIHRLKCPGLWKAPVKGRSGLVPPTPSPSLPELTSHISVSSPRGVLCMLKQILCTFLFLPIFAEKAASPHTALCVAFIEEPALCQDIMWRFLIIFGVPSLFTEWGNHDELKQACP